MLKFLQHQLSQGLFCTGPRRAVVSILLAVAVYAASRGYALLNHGPNVLFLKTPLDDVIPLLPVFVIPYVSLEPFITITLVLFLLFRTRVLQSAALSMILTWAVSYAFYFFLQSFMLRPVLTGTDFFTGLLRAVYAADNPYNCFPSLHTSLSAIMAVHWWKTDRRVGIPVAAWTALIVLSTVFVKQHYVADVIGGLALAFGSSLVFVRVLKVGKELD